MVENDHRDRVHPELLRSQQAAMPGDDDIVGTSQDRVGEAELGDGRCDLRDLFIGMRPRVARIGHELRDRCHLDIHDVPDGFCVPVVAQKKGPACARPEGKYRVVVVRRWGADLRTQRCGPGKILCR